MSEENVETLRSAYQVFNRGDFDAVMLIIPPDSEFVCVGAQSPVKRIPAWRPWVEPDAFAIRV